MTRASCATVTPTDWMNLILLAATDAGAIMFRNNVALAWVGSIKRRAPGIICLANPRPLHAGLCPDSSDLIGYTPVTITPEMVGHQLAIFTAIECKHGGGRPSAGQANFLSTVVAAGGIGLCAYNPEQAAMAIREARGDGP